MNSDDRFLLPPGDTKRSFVSRAGAKHDAANEIFSIPVPNRVCADLGANVGGFTDCLLQHGAAKVYAVDTAYGVLAWTLRKDPRVVVRERVNALHVRLPESVDLVSVDVGWTRQARILPAVRHLLKPDAAVLTLIKPHYESDAARTQRGVLEPAQSEQVLWEVVASIRASGWTVRGVVKSPLEGQKGNAEFVAWLSASPANNPALD